MVPRGPPAVPSFPARQAPPAGAPMRGQAPLLPPRRCPAGRDAQPQPTEMAMTPHEKATELQERRASSRTSASLPMRITLSPPSFEGRAENLSNAGVFFFSSDRLRVSVEIETDGELQVRSGVLVRVQRMSEDTTGYAIEFDRP